jgi:putative oxidoreductase
MDFAIIPSRFAPQIQAIFRIAVGLAFLEHGTGKLLGFPTLGGLDKMPYGLLIFTGIMELVGGVLIVIGLFTRPVAFVLSGFMAAAYFMVHFPMGFFPANNYGEAALLYCFAFLFLAAAGPGTWSVDKNSL